MNVRKCDTMRLSRSLRRGFTIVELLTVMAIITLLIGLLVPSLTAVRRFARETKQRAEFASIEAALMTFRNDYGDYPPSDGRNTFGYSGGQRLTEALVGWDLMGFHPRSRFTYNGYINEGTPEEEFLYDTSVTSLMGERRSRYLDMTHINAFRLGDMYSPSPSPPGLPWRGMRGTFVLCDVFLATNFSTGFRAGAPILYYRANRASNILVDPTDPSVPLVTARIYNAEDNDNVIIAKDVSDDRHLGEHPLGDDTDTYLNFYDYITDPRVPNVQYPHRPDSFLLISAGFDGLYGTADDIRNF